MLFYFFVNIALFTAFIIWVARSFKKTFQKEVDRLVSFLPFSRTPPGPYGVPILGYLPFMAGKNPYDALSDLAKQYGGMAFVKMGKKNILVMRDPEMIRETYKLAAFSARPNSKFKDEKIIGNKGIIQATGDVWSEHRRIILSAFRTIGLKTAGSSVTPQTSHIGEIIQHDVEEYLKFIDQLVVGKDNGNIMLERLTGRLAGSSISSCIFGVKKSFADEGFAQNVEIIEEGFQIGEMIAPFEFLPILRKVPGWWKKVEEKLKKNHCFTCKYFTGMIKEKTCTAMENHSQEDSLITMYQNEMDKRANWTEPHVLSEIQLRQILTDLFCAGTETVKYSLMWTLMYMAKHPEIQEAVQEEIDAFYSMEGHVAHFDDISKLPQTEATILEALRLRPVLPMGHARATHDAPTEYRGYEIPADTVVLSLIWDMHQDPLYWEDPLEFRPSRFMNTEGKTFRPDNFMPFGTGRRSCVGDQMAMMQLFTAFASLLKRYSVATPAPEVDLSWRIILNLLVPKNFSVELVPRKLA